MAGYAAAAAAIISGAGAYYKHKSESKKARRDKKALAKRISRQQGIGSTSFDKQEAAVRRAAEKQLGGLSTAEKDISRNLREREAVSQGRVSQELARAGLGSTSVGVNANRAVANDNSRAMADLLSQLSQARAGIESNRELALGDLSGQRANLQMGLEQELQEGKQELGYAGPSMAEGLVGAAGAGLGAYLGASGQQAEQQSLLYQIYRGGGGVGRYPQYNRGNQNYGLGGQYIGGGQSFVQDAY